MDCSLLGFSVCGVLQARILQWVAISFFRAARLLCPWEFAGKSPGVGCHSLQGNFPTQGLNAGLLVTGSLFSN